MLRVVPTSVSFCQLLHGPERAPPELLLHFMFGPHSVHLGASWKKLLGPQGPHRRWPRGNTSAEVPSAEQRQSRLRLCGPSSLGS